MSQFFQEFIQQVEDALDRQSSLGRLSFWLEKNTTLAGRPYSLKGHEAHRAIMDSRHNNSVVIKPSQIGMTEGTARLALGFLAVEQDVVAMYLLPTVGEAQRATKSRIDPIIRTSKYLKSILVAGSDSASFKQIGSSQLVTGGTYGKAVISVPTDLLVIDELDFCNSENVATAESRLTHSRFVEESTGARGIKRKLSTPTAVGVGVDYLYSQSNQLKRLVKCKHCGTHFWPQFYSHVVVPGWDKPMEEMSYIDAVALEAKGLLNEAKLLCEKCHNPITKDNLGPDYREWVAEFPSVTTQEGFRLSPLDFPDYHTPSSILYKLIDYKNNINHFKNFVLGMAHSDSSNSVLDDKVLENMTVKPIPPDMAQSLNITGCIAGLDVGKVSWLLIGKRNYATGKLDVIWAEQIRLEGDEDDNLKMRVLLRLKQYGVIKLVSDGMPYTPSILAIQKARPEGWVLPNFYTLNDSRLPLYIIDEKEYVVKSNRTKTLNLVANKINTGQIQWPITSETAVVRKHLQGMKRIDRLVEVGSSKEEESNWIKSGEDHYFHAANYLSMADDIIGEEYVGFVPMPTIRQIQVGTIS